MKKIIYAALLITTLFTASFAFAAKGYYSDQHPLPANVKAPKLLKAGWHPTDITIFNATGNTIYAAIPAGDFTETVNPGGYAHIKNDFGAFITQIILKGPDGQTTINDSYGNQNAGQNYCPHAVITVYGYNLNMISVDNSRC